MLLGLPLVGKHRLAVSGMNPAIAGNVSAYTENMADTDARPDDLPTLKAMIARPQAEIAHLQLRIAKLRRQSFGRRAEQAVRLLDQFESHFRAIQGADTCSVALARRRERQRSC